MIALAAGEAEAVKLLRRAEAQLEGEKAEQPNRNKYCVSYHLTELRRCPAWNEKQIDGRERQARDRQANRHKGGDSQTMMLCSCTTIIGSRSRSGPMRT
jgi:hypothetical protein